MDNDNRLIYRWDSAPHHKEVSTFPYHMHTGSGVKESEKTNTTAVLNIVTENVIKNLKF
ncbi:hypothetical protein HYX10_04335 [Candidatus Woesearchaeota archaeon]|nr:hypothetical protein [Candidatus Woesearchaeota archaeon]